MRQRTLLCLTACVAPLLTFSSCRRAEPPPAVPAPSDPALRTFLGISSIDSPFTLPDTARGYYSVVVFFADGKEIGRTNGPILTGVNRSHFSSSLHFFWRAEAGQFQEAALVEGGNRKTLTKLYPNWQKLSSSSAWRPVPLEEKLNYRGISIVGLIAATEGATGPQLFPSGEGLATAGKEVVAIGIVYGSDFEALKKQFLNAEPPQ